MKMIISGKNIDVTPGLRSAVEAKLGKLERYFTADTEIYVTLSVEKDRQKIEVTIPMKGNIIRSEQTSSDMYVSIDLVEEIIERQLRRYKTKLIAQQQAAASFQPDYLEGEEEEEEDPLAAFFALSEKRTWLVCGPTLPSTVKPLRCWNLRTAFSVSEP